ncbi:sugar phosphate isomerase/epimerase family protein [Acetivibrio cellulolyticus]|uniref:sugar phosphate isomerase/epimerase family protein n=1 Tax=Acetivibrio cellulolyticus TaxID=35830 RepID=UPI0001E2FBC1|nr:sugar phosphate isomerase/epimerase family protein [Acetivibrio cellulolyticus]
MNLSISNIAWESKDDLQVYDLMKKYKYIGLEIAPTRIFSDAPYEKIADAVTWSEKLRKEYDFVISSMQSIWYGRHEKLFGSDEERKTLLDYTKMSIDFAAAVGCKNLVFGCPRNRNLPEGASQDIAVEFFKELGDYAARVGNIIGMEANPPIYNTNYINDTTAALELIPRVNSKGFLLNLDVGTMLHNRENVCELVGQVKYINHVHISEPGLKTIIKHDLHQKLKDILLGEDYQGFISIEMSRTEDLKALEEVMKYVQEVFAG